MWKKIRLKLHWVRCCWIYQWLLHERSQSLYHIRVCPKCKAVEVELLGMQGDGKWHPEHSGFRYAWEKEQYLESVPYDRDVQTKLDPNTDIRLRVQ